MDNKHIETFAKFLDNLLSILDKIETHVQGSSEVLHSRLYGDMFPLATQVEITASFALRSCCPIAGVPVVSFASEEKSFTNLKAQLRKTIEYIEALDSETNHPNSIVSDQAGLVSVTLPATEFLSQFAFPNFYFHLSMVYAIARANSVVLSKGDFDGLHQYPVGFTFEEVST